MHNILAGRRHDRRALSPDEFNRLLEAARNGKQVEGIPGPDRAMMYTLAAWTGFRKSEIGSLTLRSLDLEADPPTATVEAGFSKSPSSRHPDPAFRIGPAAQGLNCQQTGSETRRTAVSSLGPCSRRHRSKNTQDDADGLGGCPEEMD